MPIRINLLAEAQAAEEMRRCDPVKRTVWAGGCLVALVLLWCGLAQFQIIRANAAFNQQQSRWTALEKRHTALTDNLKEAALVERKLNSLHRLSTNRFLWASAFNALQQTVVDQVQCVRVKTEQTYLAIDAVAAKTNSTRQVAAKPAAALERITLTIEARDWNPGEQSYNKYKEAIARFPWFQTNLAKADALRLTSLSKPALDPNDPARPYVAFTLELQYPENRRHE